MHIYIWQFLISYVVKKRERTALPKSAHQLCSRLLCAVFSLCYVQLLVCVMCIVWSVLCVVVSLCYVQLLVSVMCSF